MNGISESFGHKPQEFGTGYNANLKLDPAMGAGVEGGDSWSWLNSTDKNGMQTQGVLGGVVGAAGAISNAYLGYQGLQEARRSREMQEKYAATNLYNQAQGYNANVRDTGSNNAAINNWSPEQQQQYVDSNQAQSVVGNPAQQPNQPQQVQQPIQRRMS